MLDAFALIVLLTLITVGIAAAVWLAILPGKIAKRRNHPEAEAINVGGWLGLLLTLGVVWVLMMIWAHMHVDEQSAGP